MTPEISMQTGLRKPSPTEPWSVWALGPIEDRLPLFLLSLSNGLYFFFLNLLPFVGDGISEVEESRIFVTAWLTVPALTVGSYVATHHLRRRHFAEASAFYFSLLLTNCAFWSGFFGFELIASWGGSPRLANSDLIVWLVIALPLLDLAVILLLKKWGSGTAAPSRLDRLYTALPFLAIAAMLNFSGLVTRVTVPWPIAGETLSVDQWDGRVPDSVPVSTAVIKLTLEPDAAGLGIPQLPWPMLEGSTLKKWFVREGDEITRRDRALLEISSEQLSAVVHPRRTGGVVRTITSDPGEPLDPTRVLFIYESDSAPRLLRALPWAIVLGFFSILHRKLVRLQLHGRTQYLLDACVLVGIFLLVFDPYFGFDRHHYNYYLGPVNDLIHGKSLLVDINCQYGVLVIYFLALLFKTGLFPLSYPGLSCIINILLVAQFALVYLLLRRLLEGQLFPIVALVLVIATNAFAPWNHPEFYPSTGPLRFGLVFPLLALASFRSGSPGMRRSCWVLMLITVAIASVWSLETFIFVVAAHVAMLVHEAAATRSTLYDTMTRIGRSLALTVVAIAIAHLALAIEIQLRAGEWPHWDRYLEYVALYGTEGFGTLPINPWSPWAIIVGVYFVSLLILLYELAGEQRKSRLCERTVVAGITAFGIAQVLYFVGRSHPESLYHICIPALVLAPYWLIRACGSIPPAFFRSIAFCAYGVAAALFLAVAPSFSKQWGQTAASTVWPGQRTGRVSFSFGQRTRPVVGEAMALMEKHARTEERVALFLKPGHTTEALFLSGRTNVFPLSHPQQDAIAPSAVDRALNFEHDLQPGDLLFIASDSSGLNGVQRQIASKLRTEFDFQSVDATRYVRVIRLEHRSAERR